VEEIELLLRFIHERNVHCPRCDYNLRNLSQSVCPECREELRLQVGVRRPRFGWLILTLAPSMFSGIAAVLLAVPLTLVPILRPASKLPWGAYAMDGFGWMSVAWAIALYTQRFRFLKQQPGAQMTWTIMVWLIHVGAAVFFWLNIR